MGQSGGNSIAPSTAPRERKVPMPADTPNTRLSKQKGGAALAYWYFNPLIPVAPKNLPDYHGNIYSTNFQKIFEGEM